MSFVSADPKNHTPTYPSPNNFSPIQYDIHLKISDLYVKKYDFKINIDLICNNSDPIQSQRVRLNGVGFFDVKVFGEDIQNFRYDGSIIDIYLKSVSKNIKLSIEYQVIDPICGIVASIPDDIDPNRPIFVAMDNESQKARYWLSCFDEIFQRSRFNFNITCEKKWTVLGPQIPNYIQEKKETGFQKVLFKLEEKISPYLISIAIGNFQKEDLGISKSGIKCFAYRAIEQDHGEKNNLLLSSFGKTTEIMEWLEKKVNINFPHPIYQTIVLPLINGAAMENIMLTTFAKHFLIDESYKEEYEFYTKLITAHEMSHSYFGNMVGCFWYSSTWFKEGFANLIEWEFMREFYPEDYSYWIYIEKQALENESKQYTRPISCFQLLPDQHTYIGACFRLNMMRKELGNEKFWEIVSLFLKENWGKCIQGDQFLLFLEKESRRNFMIFYDEWFRTPGIPLLDVKFEYDLVTFTGKLSIIQQQKTTFFSLTFPILIIDSLGNKTTEFVQFNNSPYILLTFTLKSNPRQIILDPQLDSIFNIANFDVGIDILEGNLFDSLSPYHRIQSANFLSQINSPLACEILKKSLEKENHFGVRGEIAKNLLSSYQIEPIISLVKTENNSRILKSIFQQIADLKIEINLNLDFFKEKLKASISYGAKRQILRTMGVQKKKDFFDFLIHFFNDNSHLGFVRAGAYEGISEFKNREAFDILLQKLKNPESDETRFILISSLVNCVKELPNNLISQAIDEIKKFLILREVNGTNLCKWKAAEGLAELKSFDNLELVKKLKGRIAEQDLPRLEKILLLF